MTLRWEQRVRRAMLSQPSVPIAVRLSGGLLVARIRLRRLARRAAIGVTVLAGLTMLAAPFVAAVLLSLRLA